MFRLCESMEYMFGVAPAPRNMGLPWPNTTPPLTARLDNAATSYTAPPLHVCLFQGVYI
jgi:hypothetical protein